MPYDLGGASALTTRSILSEKVSPAPTFAIKKELEELAGVKAGQEEKASDYVALQALMERQGELEKALEVVNGEI